jgi:hypothetical protein
MEEQPGLHGIAAFHINSGSDTSKMLNFTDVFLGSRQDLMKFVLGWGENYRQDYTLPFFPPPTFPLQARPFSPETRYQPADGNSAPPRPLIQS